MDPIVDSAGQYGQPDCAISVEVVSKATQPPVDVHLACFLPAMAVKSDARKSVIRLIRATSQYLSWRNVRYPVCLPLTSTYRHASAYLDEVPASGEHVYISGRNPGDRVAESGNVDGDCGRTVHVGPTGDGLLGAVVRTRPESSEEVHDLDVACDEAWSYCESHGPWPR